MRILQLLAGVCLLITLNPAFVLAQSQYASLFGVVADAETGETVPFANVVVKTDNDKLITGGATDFDGVFDIDSIPLGNFDVEVSFIGYETKRVEGFRFEAGVNLLDFKLRGSAIRFSCCVIMCCFIPEPELADDVFEEMEQEFFEAFKVENQDLLEDGFFVYPNPANDILHASFNTDIKTLELVDMNGRIVHKSAANAFEEQTIQVANYPAGFYQLRFFKEGRWESQKLFITH